MRNWIAGLLLKLLAKFHVGENSQLYTRETIVVVLTKANQKQRRLFRAKRS